MNFIDYNINHLMMLFSSDKRLFYFAIFVINTLLLPGIGSYFGNMLNMVQNHLGFKTSDVNSDDNNWLLQFAEPEFKLNLNFNFKHLNRLSRNRKLLGDVAKVYKRTQLDIGLEGLDFALPYIKSNDGELGLNLSWKNKIVILFSLLSLAITSLFSNILIILVFSVGNSYYVVVYLLVLTFLIYYLSLSVKPLKGLIYALKFTKRDSGDAKQ